MNSLADYQQQWVRVVEKAFANYGSLTPNERTWFNIQSLISAVDNGGLDSYYYNSPADHSVDTIEDIQMLGFPEVAALLMKVNQLFPGGKAPADIDERNDIMDAWTDEQWQIVDDCDNTFFSYEDDLEQALINKVIKLVS